LVVEVKAESLFADPSKLHLEVTGQWQPETPKNWGEATIEEVVAIYPLSAAYLTDNLIPFLKARPEKED